MSLGRRRENRGVDGGEVVALVPVHGWGVLPDVNGFFDLAAEPVVLASEDLSVGHGYRVAGVQAVIAYAGRFIDVAVFFEPRLERP